MTTTNPFVAPAAFLKGKSIKLTVGQEIDYTALGNGPHPIHGPIPVVTVTKVKDDGSLLEGTIVCPGDQAPCGKIVTVHAGDVFQKRRCEADQKTFARRKARPAVDPAVKAAKDEEKKAKLAQKETELAAKKAEKEAAKAAEAEKKAAEKLAKAAEKAAAAEAKKAEKAAAKPGKTAAELVKGAAA